MKATVYEVHYVEFVSIGQRGGTPVHNRLYFATQDEARQEAKLFKDRAMKQIRVMRRETVDLPLRELVCTIANNPHSEWEWQARDDGNNQVTRRSERG